MLHLLFRVLQSSTSLHHFTHHYLLFPGLQVLRSETPGDPWTFYLTNFAILPCTFGSLLTMSHSQSSTISPLWIHPFAVFPQMYVAHPSVHYPTIDHQPHSQHLQILPLQHTTSSNCSCTPACSTSISSPLTSAPPTPTNCSMHYQSPHNTRSTAQLVLLAAVITDTFAAFTATYSTVHHSQRHPRRRLPLPIYSPIQLILNFPPFVALSNVFRPYA